MPRNLTDPRHDPGFLNTYICQNRHVSTKRTVGYYGSYGSLCPKCRTMAWIATIENLWFKKADLDYRPFEDEKKLIEAERHGVSCQECGSRYVNFITDRNRYIVTCGRCNKVTACEPEEVTQARDKGICCQNCGSAWVTYLVSDGRYVITCKECSVVTTCEKP